MGQSNGCYILLKWNIDLSELVKQINEFKNIYALDVTASIKLIMENDNQFHRRNYIRNQFTFIEGFTYLTKNELLDYSEKSPHEFSAAEISLLKEESYELNQKGDVIERKKYLSAGANFIFVYKLYAKIKNPKFTIDLSSHLWEAFQKALKIRNRITHPKKISDLEITDNELEIVHQSGEWFRHITEEAMLMKK